MHAAGPKTELSHGSAGPEAMKNWAYELKQTRAAKNPAFRWEVVFPKSLR